MSSYQEVRLDQMCVSGYQEMTLDQMLILHANLSICPRSYTSKDREKVLNPEAINHLTSQCGLRANHTHPDLSASPGWTRFSVMTGTSNNS